MNEQTYGDDRAKKLVELLRGLGARITSIANDADLLAQGPDLIRIMGDARSELFHYEVRATYDTPEAAESRRIVEAARHRSENLEFGSGEFDLDNDGDEPWRHRT